MPDHVIWKFFALGQRASLVRLRDTISLPTGAELLCPLRNGRSPYECVCFNIPYTLWDFEEVALLLVACEIRACGMNEQEEVNWMIQSCFQASFIFLDWASRMYVIDSISSIINAPRPRTSWRLLSEFSRLFSLGQTCSVAGPPPFPQGVRFCPPTPLSLFLLPSRDPLLVLPPSPPPEGAGWFGSRKWLSSTGNCILQV